jgi:hypothetical protein
MLENEITENEALSIARVMPCFSKEYFINILEKRLKDAFTNVSHRAEYNRLNEAILTVKELLPPSYFEECEHKNKTQHFSDVFGHYFTCKDCLKDL